MRAAAYFVIVAAVAWLIFDVVSGFFANRTIEYYASRPDILLNVLALMAIGAAVAFCFYRTAPRGEARAWQSSLWTLLLVTTAIAFGLAVIQIFAM